MIAACAFTAHAAFADKTNRENTLKPTNTTDKFETKGKHGHGEIQRMPNGSRQVRIEFWNGKTVTAESQRVDLKAAKAASLQEAVEKACHKLGFLPLFEKLVIKGTLALVNCYRRPTEPEIGWATIIKRGTPPMKFYLSRIDLFAMKSITAEEALRKVAFNTGAIKIQTS